MSSTKTPTLGALLYELNILEAESEIQKILAQAGTFTGPKPVSLLDIPVPSTPLAETSLRYAKDQYEPWLFNHCLRTFYLGAIVAKDQFPEWRYNNETFYISSILHDIGLHKDHLLADMSKLGFPLYGANVVSEFLQTHKCESGLVDHVHEAITYHINPLVRDKKFDANHELHLTAIGAWVDFVGKRSYLWHPESIRNVVGVAPRLDQNVKWPELSKWMDEVTGSPASPALLALQARNPAFKEFEYPDESQ